MMRIIVDAAFSGRVYGFDHLVELCDETGQTLGYFYPVHASAGAASPISDEEIQRRRGQREGRALQGILADLAQR